MLSAQVTGLQWWRGQVSYFRLSPEVEFMTHFACCTKCFFADSLNWLLIYDAWEEGTIYSGRVVKDDDCFTRSILVCASLQLEFFLAFLLLIEKTLTLCLALPNCQFPITSTHLLCAAWKLTKCATYKSLKNKSIWVVYLFYANNAQFFKLLYPFAMKHVHDVDGIITF